MEYNIYSNLQLKEMNMAYPWNSQKINFKDNNKTKYILYSTGDADINGRVYVALDSKIDVTNDEIRKKYNLL